jgi:hypothetical protein
MASDVERFKAACMVVDENIPRGATDEQLRAFEQKHGVRLPLDMRAFYALMKGAGPDSEYVHFLATGRDSHDYCEWPTQLVRFRGPFRIRM